MAKKKDLQVIVIPAIKKKTLNVRIVGESEFVSHKFSEKAKKMIRDKKEQVAKQGRGKHDPNEEYAQSLYWLGKDGREIAAGKDPSKHKYGFGFKAGGMKKCIVNAAVDVDGIYKTTIRRALFVEPRGGFVKIEGTPVMREDPVVVGKGAADLRYRAEFWPWHMNLKITYNANIISKEQILNLLNLAGFSTGIGECRPEKDGAWGMFKVAS